MLSAQFYLYALLPHKIYTFTKKYKVLKFSELKLSDSLKEGISAIGYENATPVQEQVIPVILNGNDIIASAQTGTGKTAAFLIPVIDSIICNKNASKTKALIIVPTRELAVQIDNNMEGLSYFTGVSSIAVYGGGDGTSFERERIALKQGVSMVICTPGRMISHLNMGYMDLSNLEYLVLDEADRMLDMGFFEDILKIISFLPEKRQNLLFSATMPEKIRLLARKILKNPVEINLAVSKPPEKIRQEAYVVYNNQKIQIVKYLLTQREMKSVLIFCSTKSSTKQLGYDLKRAGLSADTIHSDLEQNIREKVLLNFKSRRLTILVATDILSRGIDIEDIDLVINFDVPHDGEDYVHRIGRTARAESDGWAVTLINEAEQKMFSAIEDLLGYLVPKAVVPSEFGDAPAYNPVAKVSRPDRNKIKKPGKPGFNKNKRKKIID